jgi:D-glycero-D-manno-heptose 1,7-bisphosphate phosphatase
MQKALFLDRDGIINRDLGYVHKIEDFHFNEGIFELVRYFQERNYLIFVITNQSGIGRGYYSIETFNGLTQWMVSVFKKEGITIERVEYCPHLPSDGCECRKPRTGMIERVLCDYPIDLYESWLIGDKQSDIDLGYHANIGKSLSIGAKRLEHSTYHFPSILMASQKLTTLEI